ncbi:decarboxylating 6-phosphogluconate dehydrogenase [Candidatus Roizmanbacteria bacterium]|nr:decarboxylating 6-phosphogluconate dehydrogenase [Candidatus Roizmanbacteria bacterium]
MQIAMLGLGRMGSNMARKLLKDDHNVTIWNRSADRTQEIQKEFSSVTIASSIRDLKHLLQIPRIIWLMLPAGDATQAVLDEIAEIVDQNDVVVDGGNAYYKDTQLRYESFKNKRVRFLGIGVSGGVVAAETGYPLMVGGDKSAYEEIKPILDTLAKPQGGYDYFGEGGAGHFVKMIHNGIEYGIMQSLGEGFDVLSSAPYSFDLLKVAKLWQKGTLVSGFMLDRVIDALAKDPRLEQVVGEIGMASGETTWFVEQAKEENVPVEIIERSLEYRKRSQTDKKIQESFTAKMISALRNAFGGHEVKRK